MGTVLDNLTLKGTLTVEGASTFTGNQTLTGFPLGTVSAAVSAAGTTVADATALTSAINVVTTAASGTGVKLPAAANGACVVVQNLGDNDLEVYPPDASGVINGASAGAGITLAAATDVVFVGWKVSTNLWIGVVVAGPAT